MPNSYRYLFHIVLYTANLAFILFLSAHANAQNSYTDPSGSDLKLANKAVQSCEILTSVMSEVSGESSQAVFNKLQQTDSSGNLLINDPNCRESILQFVSSLCSSKSNTNQLYCQKLGIHKTNDYKSFGDPIVTNLYMPYMDSQKDDISVGSRTKFLASGIFFAFSPVKKLKLVSSVSKSLAPRIKPVLSGAMLVLATLGLTSCSDVVYLNPYSPLNPLVPQIQCDNSEFKFTNNQFFSKMYYSSKC